MHARGGTGTVATIDKLDIDLFRLPLPVAMEASAAGVMTAFDMVTARITDSDGVTGVGYTVMHEGQGGPIAAIEEGDIIAFDIDARRLDVELDEAEVARRLEAWSPPAPRDERGVFAKYAAGVSSASEGAVTS